MKKTLALGSWPLWAQTTSVLFIICICVVLATGEYVRRNEKQFLADSIATNQLNMFNTISSSAIEAIITEDIATLETIVSEIVKQDNDIFSFSISNEDNKLLLKKTKENHVDNEFLLSRSEAIKYENEIFGYIDLHWDMTKKYTEIEEHIWKIYLFTSLMMILLSTISAISIYFLVSRPLRIIETRLLNHAKGKSNNYKHKILSREFIQLYKTIDEIEELTTSKEELQNEISERKKIQTELAQARDEAIKASHAKSTFLAKMSHELRTPLNAIIGYSELITEESSSQEQENFNQDSKKITNSGIHLLQLINNILDLSKIEAGKMDFFVEKFEITGLVQSIADTTALAISKNKNKLEIICSENIGLIHNDKMKLKQIVINLLSNACKFTQQGKITLNIQRLTKFNTDWLTINIKDTGVGIEQDNLEHIFDSFSQADNSTTSKFGGTGLGLAISKNFALMMGGDLLVESELGQGSTFTLQIPAKVERKPKHKAVVATYKKPPLLKAEQIRFNSDVLKSEDKRKDISHIAIIEPNKEQQEQIKLVLETEGFIVSAYNKADEAYEKIKIDPPNIIVINTTSAIKQTISLFNQITSTKKLKNINLITIVEDILSVQFLKAGASHQLPRRYEMNDLLNKIKMSLRKQ